MAHGGAQGTGRPLVLLDRENGVGTAGSWANSRKPLFLVNYPPFSPQVQSHIYMKTPAYGWFPTTITTELGMWRGEAQREREFRGEHAASRHKTGDPQRECRHPLGTMTVDISCLESIRFMTLSMFTGHLLIHQNHFLLFLGRTVSQPPCP